MGNLEDGRRVIIRWLDWQTAQGKQRQQVIRRGQGARREGTRAAARIPHRRTTAKRHADGAEDEPQQEHNHCVKTSRAHILPTRFARRRCTSYLPRRRTEGKIPWLFGKALNLRPLPISEIIAQSMPRLSKIFCPHCSSKASFLSLQGKWRWGTGSKLAVLLVDRRANIPDRLPLSLQRHHVTRDVQAEVSLPPMVREGDAPIGEALSHVTVGVGTVANMLATTEARDVL
jgi:hypothetical protein